MCGIAGLFNPTLGISSSDLTAMRDIIAHRGPDGKGQILFSFSSSPRPHQEGPIFGGFAHRRLAIIDLSEKAHQPMAAEDGRIWITYNGEIYNYLELRSLLESKGHVFVSDSDTEVLLHAYMEWGVECLSRLRGMFAFAVMDLDKEKLFLARDRFGIKPLYYWISPKQSFAFASEIKQFTVLPGWDPSLNARRAEDYLAAGVTDHTQETLFEDVYQLRGGTYLFSSLNKLSTAQPQQWFFLEEDEYKGSYESAQKTFRSLFEDSVRVHLRADVDIGSCLSGGLDSSSIVCQTSRLLAKETNRPQQKTFSACSTVPEFDEKKYIDAVVAETNVEPYYVYPSIDKLMETLPKIIWHQDEPFGSTSIFAQWSVFEMAHKQGIKVMLDGQGADEYLIGYHSFFQAQQNEMLYNYRFRRFFKERKAMRNSGYPVASLPPLCKSLLSSWLMRILGRSTQPHLSVRAQSRRFLLETNLPMLLRYEDRSSMAHHIEARVPFVDHPLIDFAYKLPTDYKLYQAVTKRPLRTDLLPCLIRERKDKLGFATPESYWFCQHSPELFLKELQNAFQLAQGSISNKYLHEAQSILKRKLPFSFLPWRIINLGQWMQIFQVRPSY